MYILKLASQIKNDVLSGLKGYHHNLSLNIKQLEDEVVQCRLAIINEYYLKGLLPIKDLLVSINCIDVDCESLERCRCKSTGDETPNLHFEIPQVMIGFGKQAIEYIGSTDRQNKFMVITSFAELESRKYRKRGKNKPYVWIDPSPNKNGMLDCFVFDAPLIKQVSVTAAFKDPRLVETFGCCLGNKNPFTLTGLDDNVSFISLLVKDKLTKEKIYYYRSAAAPIVPNDQRYNTGGN